MYSCDLALVSLVHATQKNEGESKTKRRKDGEKELSHVHSIPRLQTANSPHQIRIYAHQAPNTRLPKQALIKWAWWVELTKGAKAHRPNPNVNGKVASPE